MSDATFYDIAFIVTAVTNHTELVAALLANALEWHADNCGTKDIQKCPHSKCLENCAVLAKVEDK